MKGLNERKKFLVIAGAFLAIYLIPFDHPRIEASILEAFHLVQYYAREHVLFCLVPAFFIAGAIANFLSQGTVIQYFGAGAKKWLSYGIASVSGVVLAVCSCTVLPLFAGIYRRGAGIGPAVAFLYAGPAINLLAVILTARVLGWELGVARAVGAVIFAIVIGLIMAMLFREEGSEAPAAGSSEEDEDAVRTPLQNVSYFLVMILILVFAAWSRPEQAEGIWITLYEIKWPLTIVLLGILGVMLLRWFQRDELTSWVETTWDFSKQILPLLFGGVLIAGFLMGRPGMEGGLIPEELIAALVGGNSLQANLTASVIGAFMYFATLTEVPILQGLIGSGMGQGPALALLLAGPALSLPNLLVIRSVLGTRKTAVFMLLVMTMAALSGLLFGSLVQ